MFAVPEVGNLVLCRDRHWIVSDVIVGQAVTDPLSTGFEQSAPQHLVALSSVEDDGLGETAEVIWELEAGAVPLATATLPEPRVGRFDPPELQAAFLDAIRWGAVTSADATALQAPFRAGISIEDYQLDPVVRALEMPRVNLGIFDDVGLGKTIEAGLVVQELLLRHRARSVWVVCPPNLCLKWQAEMQEKFGLEFRIIDAAAVRQLRRDRGLAANIFTHYPRLIVSLDWLKLPQAQKLLDPVLPPAPTYPRRFDLLIIDEVHSCAPSGVGKYATDSLRTKAARRLAGHFEHRLFLSATPHNGYRESFTALLELLDPQKFARGVEPNPAALNSSIVRRLKSTLRDDPELGVRPDGSPRFPRRVLDAIPVVYPDEERKAHQLLVEYASARTQRLSKGAAREQSAADFVAITLKKRLFSSPEAFASTLAVHRNTITRESHARDLDERTYRTVLARPDEEDFADDDEAAAAVDDALAAAGRAIGQPTPRELELLNQLESWAGSAAGRPDAKTEELLNLMNDWLRDGQDWNDERLIVFTEFRATQSWLQRLMLERGIPAERIELLYGGMDEEDRERVKREFQADPSRTDVRILLATDAASEGIDLQRHCRRMVHIEIPWNPNRLEQRNGRIDRHLQPYPEVYIHHFVSADFESAGAGSLDGDLQFLSTVAHKVEQIRDDLGSAGQVLADQVSDAMLGKRHTLDESALESPTSRRAKRQLAALERNLRERMQALHTKLNDSKEELRLSPESMERAVRAGMMLGRQSPLEAVDIPAKETYPAVQGFLVPQLTRSWSAASTDFYDPLTGGTRPITFDNHAAGRDDVALAHLGSRLVAQSLRLLRAQIWSTHSDASLSRVAGIMVDDPRVNDLIVIAHARVVVTGADGRRLHEEVIFSGGRLPESGRFSRIETLREVRELLDLKSAGEIIFALEEYVVNSWDRVRDPLFASLQARAKDRFASLENTLRRDAEREKSDIASLMQELGRTINAELERLTPEAEQLMIGFDNNEKAQMRADLDALRRRVDSIPEEIATEQALIDARYARQHPLMFPAAVTILVPKKLAHRRQKGR